MVEKKVKFMSAGQIMTFCNTCQKLKSDVDVTDMANRNYIIDGKSLMGLMSIKLGLPMRVVVNGQDEEEANECFSNYELIEPKRIDENKIRYIKRRDGQSVNEVLTHIYRVTVLLFTILTKLFGILKGN